VAVGLLHFISAVLAIIKAYSGFRFLSFPGDDITCGIIHLPTHHQFLVGKKNR